MLQTTIAGSLPKPSWLAEPRTLWPAWRHDGEALAEAKRDATLLALKLQEAAGIDIVSDGEMSRQHFVHGFLEGVGGIDFNNRVKIGIRDNRYEAWCPTVTGPIRRTRSIHGTEAAIARAYTSRALKFTLPGPMTLVDTLADAHYRDRAALAMAFAELLNEEARELAAAGVDVIQFDEPAFNVYLAAVGDWGISALHRAIEGLACTTAVHICYGYGIKANIDWKGTLGAGGNTRRSFRCSRLAGSIRCRSNAPTRTCRSSCSACSPARMCWPGSSMWPPIMPRRPTRSRQRSTRCCASCRPSGCCRAPIAAWRHSTAAFRSASWRRLAPARRWCAAARPSDAA